MCWTPAADWKWKQFFLPSVVYTQQVAGANVTGCWETDPCDWLSYSYVTKELEKLDCVLIFGAESAGSLAPACELSPASHANALPHVMGGISARMPHFSKPTLPELRRHSEKRWEVSEARRRHRSVVSSHFHEGGDVTLGGRSLLKRRSFVSLAVKVHHSESLHAHKNKTFIRPRKGAICAFCNGWKGENISVAATPFYHRISS